MKRKNMIGMIASLHCGWYRCGSAENNLTRR